MAWHGTVTDVNQTHFNLLAHGKVWPVTIPHDLERDNAVVYNAILSGGQSPHAGQSIKPETFPLPKSGKRDPYFGLSRSTYYELERSGKIRLRRLCKRGNNRGITLVMFDEVLAYVKRATAKQ